MINNADHGRRQQPVTADFIQSLGDGPGPFLGGEGQGALAMVKTGWLSSSTGSAARVGATVCLAGGAA